MIPAGYIPFYPNSQISVHPNLYPQSLLQLWTLFIIGYKIVHSINGVIIVLTTGISGHNCGRWPIPGAWWPSRWGSEPVCVAGRCSVRRAGERQCQVQSPNTISWCKGWWLPRRSKVPFLRYATIHFGVVLSYESDIIRRCCDKKLKVGNRNPLITGRTKEPLQGILKRGLHCMSTSKKTAKLWLIQYEAKPAVRATFTVPLWVLRVYQVRGFVVDGWCSAR